MEDDYLPRLRTFVRGFIGDAILVNSEDSNARRLLNLMLEDMTPFVASMTFIAPGEEDYETVETVGDSAIKTPFLEYLKTSFPGYVSAEFYTNAVAFYLSKEFLSDLSRKFGLTDLIRVPEDIKSITDSIAEDVFEAFMGTCYELGNLYGPETVNFRAGDTIVSNLIIKIFNGIDISPSSVRTSAVTQLENYRSRFDWGKSLRTTYNASQLESQRKCYYYIDRNSLLEIGVPQETINQFNTGPRRTIMFLLSEPEQEPQVLLSEGFGNDLQMAKVNSARLAVEFLEQLGVTDEYSKEYTLSKQPEVYQKLYHQLEKYYTDLKFKDRPLRTFEVITVLYGRPLNSNKSINIAYYLHNKAENVREVRFRLIKEALKQKGINVENSNLPMQSERREHQKIQKPRHQNVQESTTRRQVQRERFNERSTPGEIERPVQKYRSESERSYGNRGSESERSYGNRGSESERSYGNRGSESERSTQRKSESERSSYGSRGEQSSQRGRFSQRGGRGEVVTRSPPVEASGTSPSYTGGYEIPLTKYSGFSPKTPTDPGDEF